MKINLSILGATGSIGKSTFEIINKKRKLFEINLLSANKNFSRICNQIKKYKPNVYVITDKKIYIKVKSKFKNNETKIFNSFNFSKLKKSNVTISAIPGLAGLSPTISMINFSEKILIANKESIVCGWNIISKKASKYKTKIVPLDSEHFSILNLLKDHKLNEIKKIFITASGGPFLNFKSDQLMKVSYKEALRHPKWKMGKKISIDSATLMNKILEIIEAQKLFNIPNNKLEIIIHPNSLVHAIIQLHNGLTKFIYHSTSMVIPIANAIFDGNLKIKDFYNEKQKSQFENLIFKKVDSKIFPIIKLKDRANEYPSTSIIINACNEILFDHFLRKKIPFLGIFKILKTILNDRNYKKYAIKKANNLNQINIIDSWARNKTLEKIENYYE